MPLMGTDLEELANLTSVLDQIMMQPDPVLGPMVHVPLTTMSLQQHTICSDVQQIVAHGGSQHEVVGCGVVVHAGRWSHYSFSRAV